MTREEFKTEIYKSFIIYYFPTWKDLDSYEIESISKIALEQAEPLFEEIETQSKNNKYWEAENINLSLEISRLGEEIQKLRKASHRLQEEDPALERDKLIEKLKEESRKFEDLYDEAIEDVVRLEVDLKNGQNYIKKQMEYISALETDVAKINQLADLRQNEISGLQKILDEKDIEIKELKKELRRRWEIITKLGGKE